MDYHREPAQALSSPGSVVLTARAAFSAFSTARPLGLIMNDVMIDNPPPSSSFQSSDSSAPTTSSVDSSSTTLAATGVTSARRIPSTGPIIAGILAGIIVIATIIIIIFVKRRQKRSRRRHYPFEAQISSQSGSHGHRLSKLRDGVPLENDSHKLKHHRHSRHTAHSRTTVAPDVVSQAVVTKGESNTYESSSPSDDRRLHSAGDSTHSTSSQALNTDKIGVNQPNHTSVDESQTPVSSSTPRSSETLSSNQLEQYPPGPTLRTELPPQSPSLSSQNENLSQHSTTRNNSVLPPEARLQHLDTLIQQRAILLASSNTSDKSIYNELLLLEEQIQILRRQDLSLPRQDEPPPYVGHR